jgi:hypothetical protein
LDELISGGIPFESSQLLRNLRLYEVPSTVSRVLWFQHLYELIRDVPGDIHEYGVLWGGDMVLWDNLRVINEPGMQGSLRGLVGFDTFAGHVGSTIADGDSEHAQDGAFGVPDGYEAYVAQLMKLRQELIPTGHFTLIKGDVRESVPEYFNLYPHTTIALAYLDLDLYEPTLAVLESIMWRMPTGGVIAFDELYNGLYPGETAAMNETLARWGRVQRWRPGSGGWCWWVKP